MNPPGTAILKREFLIPRTEQPSVYDDDAAEESKRPPVGRGNADDATKTKKGKKAQRGQNKGRKFGKVRDELDLCWKVGNGTLCEFGEEFTHDIPSYLSAKPPDIHIPSLQQIVAASAPSQESLRKSHPIYSSIDVSTACPVFSEIGECRYGFKCRFLGGHVHISDPPSPSTPQTEHLTLRQDEDKKAHNALIMREMNYVSADVLKLLRSRKYPFPVSDLYLASLGLETTSDAPKNQYGGRKGNKKGDGDAIVIEEPEQQIEEVEMNTDFPCCKVDTNVLVETRTADPMSATSSGESLRDSPDARVRFAEKKRLNWRGMTYLAPLTTVGNLPFRRLCIGLGADITCGEMALTQTLLSGTKEEWSLLRRHPSERTFGVQVAGNRPSALVPASEVIAKEIGNGGVDFVDVNCGCPIDLVFKSGSGSALLDAPSKLGKILVGMNYALGEIPVTVKLRTGVKDGKNTAHKLMPRLGVEWGVGCVTLHGRTRQQRYTRLADWDYIKQCVDAVRAREQDEDLPPIPIFGNGDIFSSSGYQETLSSTGVDGIMIGRGALIKPWIFTEIKEGREWDISARERLDLIAEYVKYGLSHFGSDTTGVNATRRYLCEALSFQYRYVPIGLLEHLPGRINDRAPAFRGRDDLETLLASGNSKDWVKISEMFLGPAPGTWSFTPKHKSNAYENGTIVGQG